MMWATFGPLARLLYQRGYTAIELASVRTWIALLGAGLAALLFRRVEAPVERNATTAPPTTTAAGARLRIRMRDVPFFAAYGIIVFAGFEVLLLASLERVSVPVAVSLLYTSPLFVLILARIIFHEPVSRAKLLALPLSLTGVLLVSGAAGILISGQATISVPGIALGLAAGFGYALYTLFGRAAVARADPITSVFWTFLFAALVLALFADPVTPVLRDPGALPLLVALGLVPTLFAYILYLRALRTITAGTASMLACSEPLFAAVFAFVLLDERLDFRQGTGMALIVLAAIVISRTERLSDGRVNR
jgi:drug/metabolite transporter (DMT)-like permease